jgi:ribonucleoside-diphosphate reductase alpha chain
LALKFLSPEKSAEAGVIQELVTVKKAESRENVKTAEPEGSSARGETSDTPIPAPPIFEDAPPCSVCGSIMVRNGSCYKCLNCGTTSGCS